MRIQVLGICRFSLLVSDGFQRMPETLAERRAQLYDPGRMARRMAWFTEVFLPSIAGQTDPDFTLIIATGEDLPEDWYERLVRAVARVPQIEIVRLPVGLQADVTRAAIADRIDPRADIVAQFRLDDDDAVARDYVERVRGDFRMFLAPVFAMHSVAALDYCHGLTLLPRDGQPEVYRVTAQSLSCGLTIYMPPDHDRTVLDYAHHLVFRRMPVLSLQDQPMYVRGAHEDNDSNAGRRAYVARLEDARARQILRRRFGIRAWRLMRALEEARADLQSP
ncbi:putative rhamnosyltransferase [Albidovulum inexpectatum]|uniref:Putative rhamnosyltransferase n=1 Tax=Albidovulum inexpectatum TaxID=196587 RepID=A0A2S5JDN1_9RHOB|nr:putative rhamnosyltransferase [Albidovulum inexpectatum]